MVSKTPAAPKLESSPTPAEPASVAQSTSPAEEGGPAPGPEQELPSVKAFQPAPVLGSSEPPIRIWTPSEIVEIAGCTQSSQLDALATALAAAQVELQHAIKDAVNPHLKNKYADLASVWGAWKQAGPKQGLALMQFPSYDGTSVTVISRLTHGRSGQWVQSSLRMPVSQQNAHGVGSAITYARRYALSALVGIAPDDEDDGEAAVGRNGEKPQTNPKPANGNGNGGKHPAAARAAAQQNGDKVEVTRYPQTAPAPAAPTPLSPLEQLKLEITRMFCDLCGVRNEDGTWDMPSTMAQAEQFLPSANQDHKGMVPLHEDGRANLKAADESQLGGIKAWLTKQIELRGQEPGF